MSTAQGKAAGKKRGGAGVMAVLQRIGRSLMLPVATLPAAALLVRLGGPDLLGRENFPELIRKLGIVLAAGGQTVFDYLPLLFAIGVAIGFAKKADGSTALAAAVGYLVFKAVLASEAFPKGVDGKPLDAKVFGGIVMGLIAALLYQRFSRTKLPEWLGFFGGRRLVPILCAFAGVAVGIVFGVIWPTVGGWFYHFGEWLVGTGAWGAGIFGLVVRALIPIGMHHFFSVFPWFDAGTYVNPQTGAEVHGDIARFLAGDPTAGQFMTGGFPIYMFALPAAALAIAHTARPENRTMVKGMMISVALTSFVTGVTEPIEFSFMFVAPLLYAIHALLFGVSMAVCYALGIRDGFGFSSGAIDYVVNYGIATKPWLLIPIGLAFAALYYVIFRFAIVRFNLPTPGREPVEDEAAEAGGISGGISTDAPADTPVRSPDAIPSRAAVEDDPASKA
ncbi:PTS sugar transporter subunit IIA [Streptomyces sp. CB01201]|uniref:PTS transporter subunit EIIC n=1 Tax=Streptomyces sp. CB01201 TaxID=2020324 RepID=UPI000C26F0D1|nr:PTS transporter subunit EIIC [Streptomyces sp. CB01201]PJN02806.1 PTS sugar transporter subunit IIA [Streptomyces sp. CB01201]